MNFTLRDAVNKKKGLSPKHVWLALDEMAKYHALGHAWLKSYPGGAEQGCNSIVVYRTSPNLFLITFEV